MPKREWRSATVTVQCPADCPYRPYEEFPHCAISDGPGNCHDRDYFPADCPLEVIATECPECHGRGCAEWFPRGQNHIPQEKDNCPKCGGHGVIKKGK